MRAGYPSPPARAAAAKRDRFARRTPPTAPALRALAVAVATGLILVGVVEGSVGAGSGDGFDADHAGSGDDADAVALLERSVTAGRHHPFTGTVAISANGTPSAGWIGQGRSPELALVTATNVPGRGTDLEAKTGTSAGEAVFVDNGDSNPIHLDENAVAVLDRAFDLLLVGEDTVAGRPTRVVEARRFGGALAGRFWVDARTDLLLRREVYDASGGVVLSSEFLDVRLDAMAAAFRPLAANLPASASKPVDQRNYAKYAERGWSCCPAELAGVLELQEVRRVAGETPTIQLVYSDGLTTASVFQQLGSLDPDALRGFESRPYGDGVIHVRRGLVTYAVWSAGGVVFTVAGDTPHGLAAAVAGFPHGPTAGNDGNTNLPARLDRGMSRMVSWLNPLE